MYFVWLYFLFLSRYVRVVCFTKRAENQLIFSKCMAEVGVWVYDSNLNSLCQTVAHFISQIYLHMPIFSTHLYQLQLILPIYIGSAKYLFFWETAEYFLKFLFLFESTILSVNNGKYFHSNGCLSWPCSSLHDRSNF